MIRASAATPATPPTTPPMTVLVGGADPLLEFPPLPESAVLVDVALLDILVPAMPPAPAVTVDGGVVEEENGVEEMPVVESELLEESEFVEDREPVNELVDESEPVDEKLEVVADERREDIVLVIKESDVRDEMEADPVEDDNARFVVSEVDVAVEVELDELPELVDSSVGVEIDVDVMDMLEFVVMSEAKLDVLM